MSSQFLREILESKFGKDCVFKFSEVNPDGTNYLGNIIKIIVKYKKRSKSKDIHLICKVALNEAKMRSFIPIRVFFETEAFMYQFGLPMLEKLQRKYPGNGFVYANPYIIERTVLKEHIIIQDFTPQGFAPLKIKSLDHEHVQLVVKKIAEYHALSFATKHYYPDQFISATEWLEEWLQDSLYIKEYEAFISSSVKNAASKLDDCEEKEKLNKFSLSVFESHFLKCIKAETFQPYTVIVHGDFWMNNILFKYRHNKLQDLRMIDWQFSKHTSPVFDLIFILFTSTSSEFRKNHYKDTIDLYYKSLEDQFKIFDLDVESSYPRKVFDEHLETCLPFGLIMATVALPLLIREKDDVLDFNEFQEGVVDMEVFDFKSKASLESFQKTMKAVVNEFVEYGIL